MMSASPITVFPRDSERSIIKPESRISQTRNGKVLIKELEEKLDLEKSKE